MFYELYGTSYGSMIPYFSVHKWLRPFEKYLRMHKIGPHSPKCRLQRMQRWPDCALQWFQICSIPFSVLLKIYLYDVSFRTDVYIIKYFECFTNIRGLNSKRGLSCLQTQMFYILLRYVILRSLKTQCLKNPIKRSIAIQERFKVTRAHFLHNF